MPVWASRYLPSGANLRCSSVGASSGMAETRRTASVAKAGRDAARAQSNAPFSARRREAERIMNNSRLNQTATARKPRQLTGRKAQDNQGSTQTAAQL